MSFRKQTKATENKERKKVEKFTNKSFQKLFFIYCLPSLFLYTGSPRTKNSGSFTESVFRDRLSLSARSESTNLTAAGAVERNSGELELDEPQNNSKSMENLEITSLESFQLLWILGQTTQEQRIEKLSRILEIKLFHECLQSSPKSFL